MRDKSQRQTVLASAATIPSDSVPAVGRLSVLPEAPLPSIPFEERYALDRTLGSGGMGTVLACHDRVIGREVAVKLMLPSLAPSPDALGRFLREARVQGQLEHPSVVPVHDLAVRDDGSVFFTMKRVRGRSLEEILNASEGEAMNLRQLLTAFGRVCLVMDFAHRHGVVHRDIKPANIMLGDYGEVYVLDWGVAKTDGDGSDGRISTDSPDALDESIRTRAGALMGTPGYIAPEVIEAGAEASDSRADIYALGVILYELLTQSPMYTADSVSALLSLTTEAAPQPPTQRAPERDIAPELEAIWERATACDPALRYASARLLYEEIEAYLDGARDSELRREAAALHVESAARIIAEADGEAQRKRALRELGRALALNPTNGKAKRLLSRMLTHNLSELPAEAADELAREQAKRLRVMGRIGIVSFGVPLLLSPLVMWMGIADWPLFGIGALLMVIALVLCLWLTRPNRTQLWPVHLIAVSGALSIAVLSRLFGPAFLVPAMMTLHLLGLSITSDRRVHRAYFAIVCVALLAPFAMEWLSVIEPSYVFEDSSLVIRSHLAGFKALPTGIFLTLTALGPVTVAYLLIRQVRRLLDRAEEKLRVQAWHLRRLLPDDAIAAPPSSHGLPLH